MTVVWDVPEGWTAVPPASSMRKAQYRVPGPGGDGECIVFFFGVGQGGDPMANAVRWAVSTTRLSADDPRRESLAGFSIREFKLIVGALEKGATNAIMVSVACAAAGMSGASVRQLQFRVFL
jgi:hypothetical protein